MFASYLQQDRLILPQKLTAQMLRGQDFSPLALPKRVQIEAAALMDCDSAGLAALIWLVREAKRQGSQLIWHHLSVQLQGLLQVYELDKQGLINDARAAH